MIYDRLYKCGAKKQNCCISEYIGCKVFESVGIPVQETVIGTYTSKGKEKVVVACKDFTSQGINQTLHRIYLELNMDVNILTPYHIVNSRITNQVLIAESIIVGNVPSAYYNLNSTNPSDTISVIN